jgi:putative DNA primase/helicase
MPDGRGIRVMTEAAAKAEINNPKLTPKETSEQVLDRLASMASLDLARVLKDEAQKLGVTVGDLRNALKERNKSGNLEDSNSVVEDLVPWEGPLDPVVIAHEIRKAVTAYAVVAPHVDTAVALWVMASYRLNEFRKFPLLNITAPEMNCGKSVIIDLLACYCGRALEVENISPSAIFRTIELCQPTLLIDEADSFLKGNEDARGILNSAHKRGGGVVRTVGDDHEPKKFSTYTPIAIAGIGGVHGTILSRCIVIHMERMGPDDYIDTMMASDEPQAVAMRKKLLAWAADPIPGGVSMQVPKTTNRRIMDCWNPLFVVAHLLGGDWPGLCQLAFKALNEREAEDDNPGSELLRDIRQVFEMEGGAAIHTSVLAEALLTLDDSRWGDWNRGRGINGKGIAKLLKPYQVKSRQIKIHGVNKHGYQLASFERVFQKYCPIPPSPNATTLQPSSDEPCSVIANATANYQVADKNRLQPNNDGACSVVASGGPVADGNEEFEEEF